MVAFKLQQFGGGVPALDPRLVPDNMGASATNTWLYNGDLQGIPGVTFIRACTNQNVGRVFRIPLGNPDSFNISNSTWLEFSHPDTDVVRSPVLDDIYSRYYFCAPNIQPSYNTLARIQSGSHGFVLGINPPGPILVTAVDSNAPPVRMGNLHGLDASPGDFIVDGLSTTGDLAVADTLTGTGIIADPPTVITSILDNNTITINQAPTQNGNVSITFGTNGLTISRAYVVTWVTAYGEESAPSPPVVVNAPNTFSWNVTLPAVDPGDLGVNRNLISANIYRTVTSTQGVATYFLVTNVPIATTTYADTLTDAVVSANVLLPSTTWTPPPTYLQGLTKLPNGIVAGFGSGVNGNEIWFCEPYRPHAWPAAYAIVVDFPVVGLGVIDQTLVVLTEVCPIVVGGSTSANMTQSNLSALEPCLSRGSIISALDGVYYTSPNGLIRINYGGATNITKDLVRKDKWQNIVPTQHIRAARLQNGYYGFGIEFLPAFNPSAFNNQAFNTQRDDTFAFTGMFVDPSTPSTAFATMTSGVPIANVFNDIWTGEVFLILGNDVFWLNLADPTIPLTSYEWVSKKFQMPSTKNLGAMRVYFSIPPTTPAQSPTRNTSFPQTVLQTGQYGLISVYADDVLIMSRELRTSGELFRMPAGLKADFYQFKVQAVVAVNSIQVASSAKELLQV